MTKLYVLNFRATGMRTTGELSYSLRRGFKVVKIGDGTLFDLDWKGMIDLLFQARKLWPDVLHKEQCAWSPMVSICKKTLDIYSEERESE